MVKSQQGNPHVVVFWGTAEFDTSSLIDFDLNTNSLTATKSL